MKENVEKVNASVHKFITSDDTVDENNMNTKETNLDVNQLVELMFNFI